MLKLTYGAGLRVSETVRVRVKDIDFDNDTLFARFGKRPEIKPKFRKKKQRAASA